jgi:hypothetical protein
MPRDSENQKRKNQMLAGTITRLLYNHNDDVDGWQLDDGSLVHFPPHIGEQLSEWIGEGDEVTLEGDRRSNRNGDEVIFPSYIESQGWSLTFDQHKSHPRKGQDDKPPPEHEDSHVSNQDIMRELIKLRRLIEAWSE